MVTKLRATDPPLHGVNDIHRISALMLLGQRGGEGEAEAAEQDGKRNEEKEAEEEAEEDGSREDEGAFIECAFIPNRPRGYLLRATRCTTRVRFCESSTGTVASTWKPNPSSHLPSFAMS